MEKNNRERKSRDFDIKRAKSTGNKDRSDPYAEGVGQLNVDDLDRLRRRKLK